MKNGYQKLLSLALVVGLLASTTAYSYAESVNTKAAKTWTDVSVTSHGEVKVADGSAVWLKATDIENIAGNLNVLGSDFKETKGKLDADLAEEFSTLHTYNVGEYVLYDGELYICTQKITIPGDWDSSHWRKTNFGAEVAHLGANVEDLYGNVDRIDGEIGGINSDISAMETKFANSIGTICGKLEYLGYKPSDYNPGTGSAATVAGQIEYMYSDRFNNGITYADSRVNTSSASYTEGYTDGVAYADGRINTDSESYKAGYNNGYSKGYADGKNSVVPQNVTVTTHRHYHSSSCIGTVTGTSVRRGRLVSTTGDSAGTCPACGHWGDTMSNHSLWWENPDGTTTGDGTCYARCSSCGYLMGHGGYLGDTRPYSYSSYVCGHSDGEIIGYTLKWE